MMPPARDLRRTGEGQRGFTLVEVLAALALASLVLMSLNLATSTLRQSVDRTRESLGSQAALSAAAGIFQRDAARIARIRRGGQPGSEGYLFEGTSRQMLYPAAEHQGASQGGLYLVRLRVAEGNGGAMLIRERLPILPGEMPDPQAAWKDAVVLLEGPFDIAFSYRAPRSGDRNWRESWPGEGPMPEQLGLTVADRATGRLRLPFIVQSLQVDAEVECAAPSQCEDAEKEGATP